MTNRCGDAPVARRPGHPQGSHKLAIASPLTRRPAGHDRIISNTNLLYKVGMVYPDGGPVGFCVCGPGGEAVSAKKGVGIGLDRHDPGSSNKGPLYLQVERRIEDLLLQGRYKAGDRIPPEAELVGSLGVPRFSVLARLVERGLPERRQGSGTFLVRPPKGARLQSGLERPRLHRPRRAAGAQTRQRGPRCRGRRREA